jgi:twinkle protein
MDEDALKSLKIDAGSLPVNGIPDRKLTAETCKKYGVKVITKADGIAQHIYPYYNKEGKIVAQKVRTVEGKQFHCLGSMKEATLFGQNVFPAKGNYITVTEGEIDAMSVFQMQGSKYPVVSIKDGCSSVKSIKENYEYLDSFEKIVLCFDGDEPGRKGVQRIAALLPPKKVLIVKLPEDMKDPNEFLKAGKVEEFKNYWWKAEAYKPKDIVEMSELWDRLQDFNKTRSYISTPWSGVNEMLYGVRPSQVVVFAAGTGQGKSLFLKTFIQHILKTTTTRIGAFFLEEVAEDTAISLMSLEAGLNLRKPDVWNAQKPEDLKKWFEETDQGHRLDLFDGFDFDDIDLLIDKIRYLSKARDCKVIILDHITMIAEGSEENTVAKLNKLMAELKKIAVEEGLIILAACHLRKSANASKTHEEGGHVTLDDLKSASSIKQLSDIVIGLERNSQDEDRVKANTTILRVLKNRDFGTKGPAAAVIYDQDTTRLTEVSLEEFSEDSD